MVEVMKQVVELLEANEAIKNEVKMEQVGTWLWLSGATKPIKEELKTLGFKWSKNKSAWYHNGDSESKTKRRGFYKDLDTLRKRHGATEIKF
jgi:flavorubredoxin